MASLNGITIKGLKSIDGPEGIVWTGELYLNDVMTMIIVIVLITLNCFQVMTRKS